MDIISTMDMYLSEAAPEGSAGDMIGTRPEILSSYGFRVPQVSGLALRSENMSRRKAEQNTSCNQLRL